MKASRRNTEPGQRIAEYAWRRGLGAWEVTFEGRRDSFRDEQGAEYVFWLLLLAGTFQSANITSILTLNAADFAVFGEFTCLPLAAAPAAQA